MAPVDIDGFRSREGEGEGGTNLRRVQRVLVARVPAAGILSGSWRFPCRGQFHAKEVSSGMKTIDGIVPRCLRNNTDRTIPKST